MEVNIGAKTTIISVTEFHFSAYRITATAFIEPLFAIELYVDRRTPSQEKMSFIVTEILFQQAGDLEAMHGYFVINGQRIGRKGGPVQLYTESFEAIEYLRRKIQSIFPLNA